MVDENADRTHVPGQQPVPERDIEPPWPTEQAGAHSWAPTTGPPPVPPQPSAHDQDRAATGRPPSAADYPSLGAGTAAPGGWAMIGPPAANGWSPPQAAGWGGPAGQGVDLDMPFSLDQPAAPGADPAVVHQPGPQAGGSHSPRPGDAPAHEAPMVAPVHQTGADGSPDAGDAPAPHAAVDPATGQPVVGDDAPGDPVDGPATHGSRVPAESPWAQPPQRPATAEPAPPWATSQAGAVPPVPPPAVPQTGGEAPTQYATEIPPPPQVTPQQYEPVAETPPVPAPPGPFPPQPAWYPPPWQQGTVPQSGPVPPQYPPEGAPPAQPPYPEPAWSPEVGAPPTAEDFARRRQVRPADPVATMGVRAIVNKTGLLRLAPGRHEQELRHDIEMVRRNFGGLRQVTVVNPKGGAGKTVAILLLAMTFGQKRGGYVLAWDNNETQGTLGMRAQQDFHSRTVRDMLRDLGQFNGAHGRVGDLSQYVRSQGEGMFDVLASDESATGGEMLTAAAFAEIRDVVSRFYKLIFVDTGNNVRAQNWQAAMDATDQLVVTMSARNDSAETAARMLDHLEQSGRQRLVRQAVTVVSMPPSRKEIDLPAIQEHFAARTRAVLLAPYERLIDSGEPLRYGALSSATRDAWLKIAASVAEGL
ncbi:chromosome partitioning protein [Micromonospora sp. BQ11]|uniref:MinD/ParA family ATP-binding protein n=1 Tax=Micromonospora sp. BQ11 TaxID=3452212 RepID=UPI003F8B4CFD